MTSPISYTELAEKAGISAAYACQLLNGTRGASLAMAFKVYDATGLQFGPLANLTKPEIEMQRQLDAKTKAA